MKTRINLTLAALFGLMVPAAAQTYSVGDYYPDPKVDTSDPKATARIEGIVFEVTDDGKHGKMFSLREGAALKWSLLGDADYTDEQNDGSLNFEVIKALEPDFDGYPAFAWCASLGAGWYIPAVNEVLAIREAWGPTNARRKALNARIEAAGGMPLSSSVRVCARNASMSACYYSSTEHPQKRNKVYSVSFNSTSPATDGLKKASDSAENLLFRAVKAF